jgi:D-arabinose 1-dehydrogenase-like Zn-dependent alcohol dehydrogenase
MSEAAQAVAQKPQTFPAKAFAAHSATTPLSPFAFQRRQPGPKDVQIEILFCGVCHSDLHQSRDEWKEVMPTVYPLVPGHEIVGRVTKVGKGQKVGVVGLGGLGHMGVKFAKALGAHVVLFTTSPNKSQDAKRLGVDEVVISRNTDEMQRQAKSFNFILDTVSGDRDLNAYLQLLNLNGTMCLEVIS